MSGADERPATSRITETSPSSYPRETDALNPHNETSASRSLTSVTSAGSSSNAKRSVAEWLPYSLRPSLVWIPTALSFLLGLVVALLYWRSEKNKGLCPEASAVTGWRFGATLIAVVYAQLIAIIFNDIQRTEPFARLARPPNNVPPASRTILEVPRQIWTAFAHAFSKKHNGGKRSWIIIWASVVLVLSSVIISLSSALLASEETNIWRPYEMTRLIPKKDSTLKPFAERDTYFRTTGAILQNVTTSPWISDEYSILPFWPSGSAGSPWDEQLSPTAQTWQAETTVFRNELQCSPLELAATNTLYYSYPSYGGKNASDYLLSIRLENSEGCKYNLTFNASDLYDFNWGATASWTDTDSYAKEDSSLPGGNLPEWRPIYNSECVGDEVIIMSSQWLKLGYFDYKNETAKFLPNLTVSSYMCQSSHNMAVLPVRVSTSSTGFDVSFDVDGFRESQQEVPPSALNTSQFTKLYTDPEWYTFIVPFTGRDTTSGLFSGAMALLATQYEFNYKKMMDDSDLPKQAARIQRRHFGEILRSSLDVQDTSQMEDVTGSRIISERRIVVRIGAAASLMALFFVCFFIMIGIAWLSSIQRRPLHLSHEPATVLGTVSLVSSNASILSSLRGLDQASTGELKAALKGRYFSTSDGYIKEVVRNGIPQRSETSPRIPSLAQKESPVWIKIRTLISLVLYIAILIMAIGVVHRFANGSDLKEGFFTYRLNINSLGRFGNFTPFSIIPTTLAVLLGLWWNALDTTFRSLQPYVAMSQAPRAIDSGAYVSYQSSYWLWASGKAAKNRHWLLSLVTFGTFLAQAFTIATSALFEQTTGVVNDNVQLNRSLELRQMPHIRQVSETYPPSFGGARGAYGYDYVGSTLRELFENLSTNWLYSGVIQATLNGSEPPWSKDGWSFVPIDLSQLESHQKTSNSGLPESDNSDAHGSLINVTLTSPAIRGRVECSPVAEVSNVSTWNYNSTYKDPETNETLKYNVPRVDLFGGPLTPEARELSCCFNTTDPSRSENDANPLAIGFWTQDFGGNSSAYVTGSLLNFTVRWIHGDGLLLTRSTGTLVFPELPKIQALHCMPVFEKAEAEIMVDKETGSVQSYRLLNEPTSDDSAWSDSFIFHNLTDPNDAEVIAQIESTPRENNIYNITMVRQNLTTSYGVLFMNSLLRASRLKALSNSGIGHGPRIYEDLTDNVFNIRNNVTGLTLDFMSYAAYVKAGRNADALLDENVLKKHTQDIFSTFFQHYVNSSYPLTTGGWAYQPIGANIDELGVPVPGTFPQYAPDGKPAVNVSALPPQNTQRVANATMSTRVEVLHMNVNAVWLCIALLIWLVLTTIVVVAMQRWFFGGLRRNVESIADVLVLVAGSERLLAAVEKYGVEGLMKSDVKTRLGWFRTEDGKMRWGIEIVEDGEVLME